VSPRLAVSFAFATAAGYWLSQWFDSFDGFVG
jgi:hypothetical protein